MLAIAKCLDFNKDFLFLFFFLILEYSCHTLLYQPLLYRKSHCVAMGGSRGCPRDPHHTWRVHPLNTQSVLLEERWKGTTGWGQKACSGFSIRSYRKTRVKFLANLIFG